MQGLVKVTCWKHPDIDYELVLEADTYSIIGYRLTSPLIPFTSVCVRRLQNHLQTDRKQLP